MPAKIRPTHTRLDVIDVIAGRPMTLMATTELAPGVYAGGIPPETIPKMGFHSWQRMPDGTYLPIVKTFGPRLQLTYDIARQLGVGTGGDGPSRAVYETIRRLIMAGFIQARQLGPKSIEIDLESFWKHYQASSVPGFWTKERRKQYNRRSRGTVLPEAEE